MVLVLFSLEIFRSRQLQKEMELMRNFATRFSVLGFRF